MDGSTLGAALALTKKISGGLQDQINGKLDKPQVAGTSGQVLVSDGNGGQVWGAVGQGSIVVDDTLSVSGAAADAAVCGDLNRQIQTKAPAIVGEGSSKNTFSNSELSQYIEYSIAIPTQSGVSAEKVAFAQDIIPDVDNQTGSIFVAGGNQVVVNGTPESGTTWYSKVGGTTTYTPNVSISSEDTINVCFYISGTVTPPSGGTSPVSFYINLLDSSSNVEQHRMDFDLTTGFQMFSFTVSSDVVSMRASCSFKKNYAYDNYKIVFAAVKTAAFSSYQLDSAVTLYKSDIGANGATVIPVKGTVQYVADTKEYVDNNIPSDVVTTNALQAYQVKYSNVNYISPEMYGAVADGLTDDSTAFQSALNAVTPEKPFRAFGAYRINTGLTIAGDHLDIFINKIDYRGTSAPGITMKGSYNRFVANNLYAYFATGQSAFRLTTDSDYAMTYNEIRILDGKANGNCLEFVNTNGISLNKHAYYNKVYANSLYSTTGHIIYVKCDRHWGENSFWCKHVNNGSGYVYYIDPEFTYGSNASNKLYEFCIENASKNGIYGAATLIHCRTKECQDRKSSSQDEGNLFTFNGVLPTAKAIDSVVLYSGVDVTNATTYDDMLLAAKAKYEETGSVGYAADMLSYRVDYAIGHGPQVSTFISGDYNSDYTQPGTVFAYFNHKGYIPDHDWYKQISTETYSTYTTDREFPTTFDIRENTTIHLDDSYCAVGITKFKVIQTNGKTADIYDVNNNKIFDGSTLGAGEYYVHCDLRDPDDIVMQTSRGTMTIPSRLLRGLFTGENEEWWVEKLTVV